MAALRSVHGEATIDHDLSRSSVANEIAQTYHGMMIAIPEDAWHIEDEAFLLPIHMLVVDQRGEARHVRCDGQGGQDER